MFSKLFEFRARRRRLRPELVEICTYTVEDLQNREDLTFVNVDFEVEAIKEQLGNLPELEKYEAFFVKVEDGEITEVYGIESPIPRLSLPVCKLEVRFK